MSTQDDGPWVGWESGGEEEGSVRSDHISIKRRRSAAGGGKERAQALTKRSEGPKNSSVHWRSDKFMRLSCRHLPWPCPASSHPDLWPPEPSMSGTAHHRAFARMVPAAPLF